MGKYRVFTSETVENKIKKFAPHLINRLEKLKKVLEDNPFTGKPIKHDFLREKKWEPFRVYYLVIKDMLIVFILEFGDKKEQQSSIDDLLLHLDEIVLQIRKKYN